MADKLTPQQMQAVTDRGGRLLVSAAAGSGKTKVLVDRLMSYLCDSVRPANIDDFLMITYTKAAAAELRGKIAAKLTELVASDPHNMHMRRQLQRLYLTQISTVHSFCTDVLRQYAYRLNIPSDFRVADENECNDIRTRVLQKLLENAYDQKMEDPEFRAFMDTQGLGRDDRRVPQIILQVYDSSRCHLDPEKWLSQCEVLVSADEMSDASETIYGAYLIEQLHNWLDLQIRAVRCCVSAASMAEGLEKQTILLEKIATQLEHLRESNSWDQVIERSEIDFGRLVFPKSFEDEDLKEQIKAVRDACKKGLEKKLRPFSDDSAKVLRDLRSSCDSIRGLMQLVRDFADGYEQAKRNRRIMDFGDLEHKMLDLLLGKKRSAPTAAAMEIGARFREVMVDEYQDSNAVQDAIYNALTGSKRNLFMVGDVKQSIYQFRLADPGIFLDKYQAFTPADVADVGEDRKVVLSRNFRSSAGVLEACNDVFRTCMCPDVGGMYYGADEALYEGIPHISLGDAEAELYCVDVQEHTYPEEAAFVVQHIQKMLSSGTVRDGDRLRAVQPEDIVILLRSPGSAGIYFQQALDRAGIRYTTGGGVDLLKTEEISVLYSILQVVYNPRVDIPLVAALSSPAFGFSADDLAFIRSKHKTGAFYDALLLDDHPKTKDFLSVLQKLRGAVRQYSLTGLLDEILLDTSLEEIYGAMENSQARLENLQSFYQLAAEFEAGGNRDLGYFLQHLETMSEKGLITAGEQSAAGCVSIMSIHKSKGLEFPVVYLCCLGREFNMESQKAAVLCHKSMGLGMFAVDHQNRLRYPTIAKRAIAAKIGMDSVSEELRVLYVAMTRARDRLIMTYASNNLQKELTEIVQRLQMNCGELLIKEAVCPGDWVLLTALQKTEAGELFALAGYPGNTATGAQPWKIRVVTALQPAVDSSAEKPSQQLPLEIYQNMQQALTFQYAHPLATITPSKQTATGIKGRHIDEEAAENTVPKVIARQWRDIAASSDSGGIRFGNAMHAVMQYINYGVCVDKEAVHAEIGRLVRESYISQEQADMVDQNAVTEFFTSEIGQKLRCGEVLREFKFSILQDAAIEDPQLMGEQILLQGVVDCALIEDDGITIIDFKTDHVTRETLSLKVGQYTPQVAAYAQAMEKIYGRPVKQRFLYFFNLNQFISV